MKLTDVYIPVHESKLHFKNKAILAVLPVQSLDYCYVYLDDGNISKIDMNLIFGVEHLAKFMNASNFKPASSDSVIAKALVAKVTNMFELQAARWVSKVGFANLSTQLSPLAGTPCVYIPYAAARSMQYLVLAPRANLNLQCVNEDNGFCSYFANVNTKEFVSLVAGAVCQFDNQAPARFSALSHPIAKLVHALVGYGVLKFEGNTNFDLKHNVQGVTVALEGVPGAYIHIQQLAGDNLKLTYTWNRSTVHLLERYWPEEKSEYSMGIHVGQVIGPFVPLLTKLCMMG